MIGIFLCLLGLFFGSIIVTLCMEIVHDNHSDTCNLLCDCFLLILLVSFLLSVITYAYVYGQTLPRRRAGRRAKLAAYLTTLLAAILLRLCMGYSLRSLELLVLFFLEVLVVWKLLHGAADISFCDALMGALMQIAVHETLNELYAVIAVLLLSGAVIFWRYWFYSTPETCSDLEASLEMPRSLVESPKRLDNIV